MDECALALDLSGVDLSVAGNPAITDVVTGTLSSIGSALPGVSVQVDGTLGIEAGADQMILIFVGGLGYELI